MNIDRVMPRSWLALGCLVGAFAFLGAALSYAITERADAPPGPGSTDVGFLQDMITHHEQARALSYSELENGTSEDIKVFAREIIQQQSYEIGMMDRMLDEWGYARENRPDTAMEWMGMGVSPQQMPGMASGAELQALQDANGEDADALFLALMKDHHRGGVAMATAAADSAGAPWVRDLAARMARNQAIEINEMDAARDRAGLTDVPDGYEPGPFADMSEMSDMEHVEAEGLGADDDVSAYAELADAVCDAATAAAGAGEGEAGPLFFDGAHDGLHDLAAATTDVDRVAAADLLRDKEAVESILEGGPSAQLAEALAQLNETTTAAIGVIDPNLAVVECLP